jgi:hypothetical protein
MIADARRQCLNLYGVQPHVIGTVEVVVVVVVVMDWSELVFIMGKDMTTIECLL